MATRATLDSGVAVLVSVEWWEPRSASSQTVILKAASGQGWRAVSRKSPVDDVFCVTI